jgi:hypothetical protein
MDLRDVGRAVCDDIEIQGIWFGATFVWPDPWTDIWDEMATVIWTGEWHDLWSRTSGQALPVTQEASSGNQ